jgi:predicted DCC family thiol-disulfide oxidoreductase YuxK
MLERPVLVYDDACKLCRFAARTAATLDRDDRLAFLPLADPQAEPLLAEVPPDVRNGRWWLVLRDGTPLPGDGGAGVAALHELRLTHRLGPLLRSVRAAALVDGFDALVSRHRTRLGRVVPDGEAPRRYP